MNRAELLEALARAEAVVASARYLLRREAEIEWTENGTRAVWDTRAGQAVASITHDTLGILDEQAFLRWLREGHGGETEVVEVTALRVRNPKWLDQVRETLAGAIRDGKSDAPPGTKLLEGGTFRTLSITFRPDLKDRLANEALAALLGGDPSLTTALE